MKKQYISVAFILFINSVYAIEPKKADIKPCVKIRGDESFNAKLSPIKFHDVYIAGREDTIIGHTAYDYQANGSFGQRVMLDSYDQACINWMWMDYPGQTTRYCAFNKRMVGGTYIGATQVSNSWSGYVQLDVTRDANPDSQKAVIAYNWNGDSWIDIEPCSNPKTLGVPGHIWPYVAATGNGKIVLATGNSSVDTLHLYITTDKGNTWTSIADFDSCGTLSQFVRSSQNSNKVVFVHTQYITDQPNVQLDNDVYYILSTDGGVTWGPHINITNYQPYPVDSVRAYCCVNAVFDLDDNLHIVWAGRKVTTDFYEASKIFHWDEVNDTITIVSSPSIYYSEPGGWWIETSTGGDYGAWRMPADQPQLTVGIQNGDLICFWGGNDDYTDYSAGGFINGEIFGALSSDGGLTWSCYGNITNTRSPGASAGQCMDEDYFTVYPRFYEGAVYFHGVYTYVLDKDAGAWPQIEGMLTDNPVYCYYYFWQGGSTENDQKTLNSQEPYETFHAGPLVMPTNKAYRIFDITGRQIHTLNPAPGIYFIEANGKMVHKIIKIK